MTVVLRTTGPRPPRIVIDTAVVVTALVFGGGEAARLRQAWQSRRCRPMVCAATVQDLTTKLMHPRFGFTRNELHQLVDEYVPHALKVRVPGNEAHAGDAAELPVMAFARLAMAGRAHAVVTAEPDFLALGERFVCPVLSLATFLDSLDAHLGGAAASR